MQNNDFYSLIPCYYHFLDGYINEDYGNTIEKSIKLLSEMKLLEHYNLKNIILYNSFYNKIRNSLFLVTDNEINELIAKEKSDLDNIIQKHNCLIYPLKAKGHAISLYIIKDNENINITFINSGLGIDKHHQYYNNKYNLWKSNSLTIDEFNTFINKIIIMRILIDNFNQVFKDVVYKNTYIAPYLKKHNIRLDIENLTHKSDILITKTMLSVYYDIFNEYKPIKNTTIADENILTTFIQEWNKHQMDRDVKRKYLDVFYNKNNFILHDGNLFTDEQKSGSCSWFSLYWAIFFHILKHNGNIFDYLINLNVNFYEALIKLYSYNNPLVTNLRLDNNYWILLDLLKNKNVLPNEISSSQDKIWAFNKQFTIDIKSSAKAEAIEDIGFNTMYTQIQNIANDIRYKKYDYDEIRTRIKMLEKILRSYMLKYDSINYGIIKLYILAKYYYDRDNLPYFDINMGQNILKLQDLNMYVDTTTFVNNVFHVLTMINNNIVLSNDEMTWTYYYFIYICVFFIKYNPYKDTNILVFTNEIIKHLNIDIKSISIVSLVFHGSISPESDVNTKLNIKSELRTHICIPISGSVFIKDCNIEYFINLKNYIMCMFNNMTYISDSLNHTSINYIYIQYLPLIYNDIDVEQQKKIIMIYLKYYISSKKSHKDITHMILLTIIKTMYHFVQCKILKYNLLLSSDSLIKKIERFISEIMKKSDKTIILNDIYSITHNKLKMYENNNSEISNVTINENILKYNNDDYTIISIELSQDMKLSSFLMLNVDNGITLNDELVCGYNIKHRTYIILSNNNVIALTKDDTNKITKFYYNTHEILNYNLQYDEIIKKYPFYIFAPLYTINYIIYEGGVFYLIIMCNRNNFKFTDEMTLFSNTFYDKNVSLKLKINNNYLIPILNKEEIIILNELYSHFGCHKIIMNSFDIDKEGEYRYRNYNFIDIIPLDFCNIKTPVVEDIPNFDIYDMLKKKLNITYQQYVKNNDSCVFNYINKDEHNDGIKQLQLFYEKYKICNMDCGKNNIDRIILIIDKDIDFYMNIITHEFSEINIKDELSIFSLIFNNYNYFVNIINYNLLLKNLYRLKNIFLNCNGMWSCQEINEINEILTRPIKHNSINHNFVDDVFEIIFGSFIKEEQWNKYNEIKDIKPLNNIYHFMMGKGKSSVISPLIILNKIHTLKNSGKLYLIVPNHLLKQTTNDMYFLKFLFRLDKLVILNDSDAKHKLVKNEYVPDDIMIFDEFDMMFDPIQSNFNVIINSVDWIDMTKYDIIFSLITDNIHNDMYSDTLWYNEVMKINQQTYTKNINYGMSKITEDTLAIEKQQIEQIIDPNQKEEYKSQLKVKESKLCCRHVIPYSRKDSPIEGSLFSSILITLILTIKYFKVNNYVLEKEDLYIIYKTQDIETFDIINFEDFELSEQDFCEKISIILHNKDIEYNKNVLKKYLFRYVIKHLKLSSSVINCSFIDLINYKSKWKTGYSGTMNITLPDVIDNITTVYNVVNKDYEELFSVYFALTGEYKNSENKIYNIKNNNIEELYNIIKKNNNKHNIYSAIIDVSGLFKNMKNLDVVRMISSFDNYKDKYFVYLDDSDNKMVYHNNITSKYNNETYSDTMFYYYSQKNIVGIDFKQPTQLRGLVIINPSNTYSEVAQGIYRLRKLNKGHIIDIVYESENEISKKDLYKQLYVNEKTKINNKKKLLELQHFKFIIRNTIKGQCKLSGNDNMTKDYNLIYFENNILPFFHDETISYSNRNNINKSKILNKINEILFNDCLMSDYKHINIKDTIDKYIRYFNALTFDELNEVFFGGNTTNIDIAKEISTQLNIQINHVKYNFYTEKLFDIQYYIIPKEHNNNEIIRYYLDNMSIMLNMSSMSKHCVNFNVYFSLSLFGLIEKSNFYLIKMENNYLLEQHIYIFAYYNKYPIYDLNFKQINTINPTKFEHKECFDFLKMFNNHNTTEKAKLNIINLCDSNIMFDVLVRLLINNKVIYILDVDIVAYLGFRGSSASMNAYHKVRTQEFIKIINNKISFIIKNYDNWYLNLFENYNFLTNFNKKLDIDIRISVYKKFFNIDYSLQNKYLKYKTKYLRLKKKLIYKNIK
jgi:hypothetical protein